MGSAIKHYSTLLLNLSRRNTEAPHCGKPASVGGNMEKLLTFILLFFSLKGFSQRTADVFFDIAFPMEINDRTCYEHTTAIKQDSFVVDYYFMYHFPIIPSTVKWDSAKNTINIKGGYTYLVAGENYFYPMLVITVKPFFKNHIYCNRILSTYIIDFQNIKFPSTIFRDTITITIDKISLGGNPYITVSGEEKKIAQYSQFQSERIKFFLHQFFPHWHEIKRVN